MPSLPPDGTAVAAMTYPSDEYDRPAERVSGVLTTRWVAALGGYVQCWVAGVQVDPATVSSLPAAHAGVPAARYSDVVPVRQSTGWTCGPAALASVASGLGLDVSEADVARLAGADPDQGTPPEAMLDAAHQLGLQAVGQERMTLQDLAGELRQGHPVIVCLVAPWLDSTRVTADSGHWAVVVSADAGGFTLQDPATGTVRLTAPELLARWKDADADGRVYTRWGMSIQGVK